MVEFSIIVPIYNVEKYLARCIDSILRSTYQNFEVILVNDGSVDQSLSIAQSYASEHPKKVTLISQENQGLSVARNTGIKVAKGDYFIFIDSDDYIDSNLFQQLHEQITRLHPELIRFQCNVVSEKGNKLNEIVTCSFDDKNGFTALKEWINEAQKQPFVMAWLYCYQRHLFTDAVFYYEPGKFHEDYLTIRILLQAKHISSISFKGYYYVQSDNSIMRNMNYQKTLQKVKDTFFFCHQIIDDVKKASICEQDKYYIAGYMVNGLLHKLKTLNKKDRKTMIQEMKEKSFFHWLPQKTIKQRIKKGLLYILPQLYLEVMS